MAVATVACPKCEKTFRGSDEVKGKRIRCPLCGEAFVVKGFVNNSEAAKAKPEAPAKAAAEDDDDANPYGVTNIKIAARCPNCANEMESETAVICLYCGYNTQTRTLGKTKRLVHQTGGDKAKWLMPGIGALIGLLVLILLQNLYIFVLGGSMRGEDSFLTMFFSEPVYLWLTLICAGVLWVVGRFVFKRLILEPTPPENVVE